MYCVILFKCTKNKSPVSLQYCHLQQLSSHTLDTTCSFTYNFKSHKRVFTIYIFLIFHGITKKAYCILDKINNTNISTFNNKDGKRIFDSSVSSTASC